MKNGSTAGPLTLEMEKKNVVTVTGNEDPHSQLLCHCLVATCCESRVLTWAEMWGEGRVILES